MIATPALYLETGFVTDGAGRIVGTREPNRGPGPLFTLARGALGCAWRVRADVPADVARELCRLAGQEPPATELAAPPLHAERYAALLPGARADGGPAMSFPDPIDLDPGDVESIEDEQRLARHFRGWKPGELAAGCSPMFAILDGADPVSVCFCARRSDVAAEAGVETAAAFRGRGLAPRVTAAWARAIRDCGRLPLYSTSWTNTASLAVANKLGLIAYAASFSLLPAER